MRICETCQVKKKRSAQPKQTAQTQTPNGLVIGKVKKGLTGDCVTNQRRFRPVLIYSLISTYVQPI